MNGKEKPIRGNCKCGHTAGAHITVGRCIVFRCECRGYEGVTDSPPTSHDPARRPVVPTPTPPFGHINADHVVTALETLMRAPSCWCRSDTGADTHSDGCELVWGVYLEALKAVGGNPASELAIEHRANAS